MNKGIHIPTAQSPEAEKVWEVLKQVTDPEIPVLTVMDMGIIRLVEVHDGIVEVTITPTYSGCPAMDMISVNIRLALIEAGYRDIRIHTVLDPAWTTDWMTEEGKQKLRAYGIAPPAETTARSRKLLFDDEVDVECPRCQSHNTRLLSQFGSTACKALYQCNDCKEPFDYFKCH